MQPENDQLANSHTKRRRKVLKGSVTGAIRTKVSRRVVENGVRNDLCGDTQI